MKGTRGKPDYRWNQNKELLFQLDCTVARGTGRSPNCPRYERKG